eukprot:SM000366S13817  [mRNA]  locus=s366:20080:20652:+ [translate_table: standard]
MATRPVSTATTMVACWGRLLRSSRETRQEQPPPPPAAAADDCAADGGGGAFFFVGAAAALLEAARLHRRGQWTITLGAAPVWAAPAALQM